MKMSTAHTFLTKVFALLMALVLTFGLLPINAAAVELSPGELPEEQTVGFLGLYVGNLLGGPGDYEGKYRNGQGVTLKDVDGSPFEVSYLANVMMTKDGKVIPENSVCGLYINAKFIGFGGKEDTNKRVGVYVTINEPTSDPLAEGDYIGGGNGETIVGLKVDQNAKETVYYIYAVAFNPDGSIAKTTVMNVTVKQLHAAVFDIRYLRAGMQIRGVDNIPFGLRDYVSSRGDDRNAANTTGIHKDNLAGWTNYTSAFDGKEYAPCYHDVSFEDNGSNSQAAVGVSGPELLKIWDYLEKWYYPHRDVGDTVTIQGPAYIKCYGKKDGGEDVEKYYNLEYYHKEDSGENSPNDYASWGDNTKIDFVRLRFMELIIPVRAAGKVIVRYLDEDEPTKEIKEETIHFTDQFQRANNYDEFEMVYFWQASAAFSEAYANAFGGWWEIMKGDNVLENFQRFKDMASSLIFDPATNQIVATAGERETLEKLEKVIQIRDEFINGNSSGSSSGNGIKNNDLVNYIMAFYTVIPPGIEGYEFDFGVGYDAMTACQWGNPLILRDTGSVDVVVTQEVSTAVVNLYYKGIGETTYKVKVRNNGVIDESYTHEYKGVVGDIIEEEEVDTTIVPPDWTINDIENVPMELVKDPEENIIIIDCSSEEVLYTIMYYLDGVFAEQETVPAKIGDTITNPPYKGFPGYKLDHIDGTPLLIKDSSGVIRIYFVKMDPPAAAAVNAKLFKDEYRTQITRSKSGYGVYGLFYVDVSEYVNAREYPSWSTKGGCSANWYSKTEKKYININVTATATYKEGMPITVANKNGKTVTIDLVKDTARSSETVWVFRFPPNPESNKRLPKTYIPINWKDGTNWTINFKAVMTADEYHWTTSSSSVECGGHLTLYGIWYHTYTIHPLREWYEDYTKTFTGSASIMVNGSMYEDDFTGGRD